MFSVIRLEGSDPLPLSKGLHSIGTHDLLRQLPYLLVVQFLLCGLLSDIEGLRESCTRTFPPHGDRPYPQSVRQGLVVDLPT